MKRSFLRVFLALCAILVCASCAVPGLADGIDLKGMTDDELVSLLDAVNREIADRGIRRTAVLSKGAYIAGRDLPAGSYVYTCLATGSDWGNVTVYSEYGEGKQLLWEVVAAPEEGEEPETIYITLHEGDQLKSGVPFSLTIAGGVLFK